MAVYIDQEDITVPLLDHDDQPAGRLDVDDDEYGFVLEELTGDQLTGDALTFDHTVENRELVRGLYIRLKLKFNNQTGADANTLQQACLQPLGALELFKSVNFNLGGRQSSGTTLFSENKREFKNALFAIKCLHDDKPNNSWQKPFQYELFYPKGKGSGDGVTAETNMTVETSPAASGTAAITVDQGKYNINHGSDSYPELDTQAKIQSKQANQIFVVELPLSDFGIEIPAPLGHEQPFLPPLRYQIELYKEHVKRALMQRLKRSEVAGRGTVFFTHDTFVKDFTFTYAAFVAQEKLTLTESKWQEFYQAWQNEPISIYQIECDTVVKEMTDGVTTQTFANLTTEPYQYILMHFRQKETAIEGALLADPFRYHYIWPHLKLTKTEVVRGSDANKITRNWALHKTEGFSNYKMNYWNIFREDLRTKEHPYIAATGISTNTAIIPLCDRHDPYEETPIVDQELRIKCTFDATIPANYQAVFHLYRLRRIEINAQGVVDVVEIRERDGTYIPPDLTANNLALALSATAAGAIQEQLHKNIPTTS